MGALINQKSTELANECKKANQQRDEEINKSNDRCRSFLSLIGNKQIPPDFFLGEDGVHRCVLEARSEFYRSLFQSKMLEVQKGKANTLCHVPRAVYGFLQYLYEGDPSPRALMGKDDEARFVNRVLLDALEPVFGQVPEWGDHAVFRLGLIVRSYLPLDDEDPRLLALNQLEQQIGVPNAPAQPIIDDEEDGCV